MSIANAWSDVIRSNWSSLQLFVDLRTGGYADLSDNARVVTLNAGGVGAGGRYPQPQNGVDGKRLDMGGIIGNAGTLSVPTAAALDLRNSGTIAAFFRTEVGFLQYARFAYKRNAGVSCAYDWYAATAAGAIELYDGTTAHALGSVSWSTLRSLVAAFTIGAAPRGYGNGVRLGAPATLWAPTVDVTSLYLPSSAGAGMPGVGWHCFLLFSTQLTGAEISQLHNDFVESAHYL